MPIRNVHLHSQNATREYPLGDSATATSTAGTLLPSDIIADASIRFPRTLGRYAFVSAVTVTPTLVSVVLQACDGPEDTDNFAPLAVVSLPKPVQPWRAYALRPQAAGVGGWLVFGGGVDSGLAYTGRFTPAGGLLAPRAARAYRPLPVTGVGHVGSREMLQGIVRLRADAPLQVVGETREINGVVRRVAVVRLVETATATGTAASAAQADSVFAQFAGPCAARPESGNCGDPEPIEYINAVTPDCNGNLTISLRGCAKLGKLINDSSGAIIDCNQGLRNACLGDTLPDAEGRLRTEYPDQCISFVSELVVLSSESFS